jgi:hypothetical protein
MTQDNLNKEYDLIEGIIYFPEKEEQVVEGRKDPNCYYYYI